MMKRISLVALACLAFAVTLPAQDATARQYYSPWRKHSEKAYYYRWYYYKAAPGDRDHKYHYGIYYPSRGKRVYMYNPVKKRFWGYYDMETERYSLLPEDKRRESIDDIPAEAFPKPGEMPPIPESSDGVAMLKPPDDLPKLDLP